MVDVAIPNAPHSGRRSANSNVTLEAATPATRVSLRANTEIAAKLTRTLGVKLPTGPNSTATKGGRSALWLGPDEWLIIDDTVDKGPDISTKLADFDCSVVDVSHRNTAVLITGAGAEDIINSGCPRDLAMVSFPAGACSRTLFGKIEIVLWRLDDTTFRIEVWRSFSDYLWDYLVDAAKHGVS